MQPVQQVGDNQQVLAGARARVSSAGGEYLHNPPPPTNAMSRAASPPPQAFAQAAPQAGSRVAASRLPQQLHHQLAQPHICSDPEHHSTSPPQLPAAATQPRLRPTRNSYLGLPPSMPPLPPQPAQPVRQLPPDVVPPARAQVHQPTHVRTHASAPAGPGCPRPTALVLASCRAGCASSHTPPPPH